MDWLNTDHQSSHKATSPAECLRRAANPSRGVGEGGRAARAAPLLSPQPDDSFNPTPFPLHSHALMDVTHRRPGWLSPMQLSPDRKLTCVWS